MKKVIFIVLTLLLVSGAANAQFMGIYTADDHSYWCATGVGFYPVEIWIMCLPGPLGVICNEFSLCYPPNVIQSTVTKNMTIISVDMGDLPSGWSVCYILCQYDWFWIAHQTLYVTTPDPAVIEVCPHPGVGVYQIANCEPGYPVEPCAVLTNFFVNYGPEEPECQGTATEDASWGAIKSMMD
jgi:hypothetical protein